jgi:hypothetical protein
VVSPAFSADEVAHLQASKDCLAEASVAGAAIAGRGGRNATPRPWRQVQFGCPARADPRGVAGTSRSSASFVRVRRYVEHLGQRLQWLVLDYVFPETDRHPLFIDSNRHLVEPIDPVFSGITSLIYSASRNGRTGGD